MKSNVHASSIGARLLLLGALVTGAFGLVGAGSGSDAAPRQPAFGGKYIGVGKCKNCHKADDAGNQHGVWSKGPHAKAFETLASDAAKKIAAEMGIEDAQKSDKCLPCHTTGHGEPDNIRKGFKVKNGVQCESCHGAGETHMKARFKAAAAAEEGEAPAYVGVPEEEVISAVTHETCVKCHNENSPTFKPFCFHLRMEAIRHLNPLKPRTDAEKAAFLNKDPKGRAECVACHEDK